MQGPALQMAVHRFLSADTCSWRPGLCRHAKQAVSCRLELHCHEAVRHKWIRPYHLGWAEHISLQLQRRLPAVL